MAAHKKTRSVIAKFLSIAKILNVILTWDKISDLGSFCNEAPGTKSELSPVEQSCTMRWKWGYSDAMVMWSLVLRNHANVSILMWGWFLYWLLIQTQHLWPLWRSSHSNKRHLEQDERWDTIEDTISESKKSCNNGHAYFICSSFHLT